MQKLSFQVSMLTGSWGVTASFLLPLAEFPTHFQFSVKARTQLQTSKSLASISRAQSGRAALFSKRLNNTQKIPSLLVTLDCNSMAEATTIAAFVASHPL